MNFRKTAALALLALAAGSLFACSGKENAFAAARRNDQEATAAASLPTRTPVPTPVQAPGQTAAAQAAGSPASPAGDAARGQTIFASLGCVACHSTGSNTVVGPGLQGVGARAAARVPGLTADAYVKQSVRSPGAFIVPTFNNLMPAIFATIPDADLNDVVAYLMSLK